MNEMEFYIMRVYNFFFELKLYPNLMESVFFDAFVIYDRRQGDFSFIYFSPPSWREKQAVIWKVFMMKNGVWQFFRTNIDVCVWIS